METSAPNSPPTEQSAATPPARKAKLPLPSTLPEFVAAKGGQARLFLRKLKKSAFAVPSADDLRQMAQMLRARPDGALRLLLLLQALDEVTGTIRESTLSLAEEFLRDALPATPLPLTDCRATAERLLRPADPKGPKPKLDLFGVVLLLALHRGWLADDELFALLARAFPLPKAKPSRFGEAAVEPLPLAIILGSPLKRPAILPLLTLHSTWEKRTAAAAAQIRQLQATVARLEAEKAGLAAQLEQARAEITGFKADAGQKAQRIRELETEITDSRTAAQHRHDALKGRVRGFLEGELSRWLQNAAEAVNIEPPRVRVIQERLQSALAGIQKEAQWLQSSD
jgi:uncharacterized protein (UPF0335 family)